MLFCKSSISVMLCFAIVCGTRIRWFLKVPRGEHSRVPAPVLAHPLRPPATAEIVEESNPSTEAKKGQPPRGVCPFGVEEISTAVPLRPRRSANTVLLRRAQLRNRDRRCRNIFLPEAIAQFLLHSTTAFCLRGCSKMPNNPPLL